MKNILLILLLAINFLYSNTDEHPGTICESHGGKWLWDEKVNQWECHDSFHPGTICESHGGKWLWDEKVKQWECHDSFHPGTICESHGGKWLWDEKMNHWECYDSVIKFEKACDDGNAKGCILLSQMYQIGEGVEQNIYKSKYYFLLGAQEQNKDYSQVSKPVMPEFHTITEKTLWIATQKNKIDKKYAQLEEKMALCGKNLLVTINDTKTTIDQKYKNADKNFEQYENDRTILKALESDYRKELYYIGYEPSKTFSQFDKFANIYLIYKYNKFKYMVAWDPFSLDDVDSYRKYLEYAYENIDRLKYERKIEILKGRYSSDNELSPSERVMIKNLIQSQNRAKQQELVNKFLKD